MSADAVEWLRAELAKRTGPWQGVDGKGNPVQKEPLCTGIVLMPRQAAEILAVIDGATNETEEA